MPIPSSAPVSFNDIQNEFGGTNPISMDEYYNLSGKYAFNVIGIPSSGRISINDFRGKSKNIIISASVSGTNNTINNFTNDSNFKYAYFANSGTFSINNDMACEVLLIGGGGGGGFNNGWEGGGGGGAGGLGLGTINFKKGITYNITIGNGGTGGQTGFSIGQNGSNTTIIGDVINENAYGGGGGSFYTGNDGGSGGGASGASQNYSAGNATKGLSSSGVNANITYYGNRGGDGINPGGGGGGGGAGAAGNPTAGSWNFEGAVGGIGLQLSITGTPTYYAGGGGGARGIYGTNGGAGGLGGGGRGGGGGAAVAGTANTGGGGGGVGAYDATGGGASGGSGLVIIKYALKVYTTGNSNTINTPSDNANHRYAYFINSGTFTTINSLTCDILIVGGGGSGGGYSGGGGGGDVIYKSNFSLASGTYTITVGKGGIAPRSGGDNYINGNPGETSSITSSISNFTPLYAAGGGGGIGYNKSTPTTTPTAGSSAVGNYSSGGGGGAGSDQQNYSSGSGNGVSGDGGRSVGIYASGGGGGATGNGGNPNVSSNIAGIGGAGFTSAITGTNIGYGGGGGGSSWVATNANIGVDGGGNGGTTSYSATDGAANRGGGGGGAATAYVGANGGSGVIIIRYANN